MIISSDIILNEMKRVKRCNSIVNQPLQNLLKKHEAYRAYRGEYNIPTIGKIPVT